MAAIVLLHAFPLDANMWRAVEPLLAVEYRPIAIDLGGAAPWTVDEAADAVAARLDALGVVCAAVVGVSMGGYVALALAERHPGRVAALVLCDTRASADSPEARAGRDAGRARLAAGDRDGFLAPLLDRLVSPSTSDAVRAEIRRIAEAQPTEVLASALVALRDRPDRTALLPSLRLPTLVVRGADDALVPDAEARTLAASIPGASYVTIPRAGHLPPIEQPDAVARALLDFLSIAI